MSNQEKAKISNRWLPSESENTLQEAIKELDVGLKSIPDDLNSMKLKGVFLHKICHYNQKKLDNSIKFFDKILQAEPSNKEFLKRKGM